MDILALLPDVLLLLATLGLAIWCRALSRRLATFNTIDSGLSATVDGLMAQVDALAARLTSLSTQAEAKDDSLQHALTDADDRIGRMEILLTSLEALEDDVSEQMLEHDQPSAVVTHLPSFRHLRADGTQQDKATT